MTALHEHTLRTCAPPAHVQLACNGTHLALPHTRTTIGVWSLEDLTCKPMELCGHRKPVTALNFNHRTPPDLLCSCAEDYIIVWNIDKSRMALDIGAAIRGVIIGTTLGFIQYCTFNFDDQKVAVCVEKEVIILNSKEEKIETTLDGHNSRVNCAEFCPHYTATLVTAGDDRTFKVWDISEGILLYQSTIISSSPFISLNMNPMEESFALGTADGQVRVYDLKDGNGFRCLHHLDIHKLLKKLKDAKDSKQEGGSSDAGPSVISSRPAWQRADFTVSQASEDFEPAEESGVGSSVLAMFYTLPMGRTVTPAPTNLPFLQQENTIVRELLENAPMLVVVTTGDIIHVNARTLEPCSHINLQEPFPSSSMLEESNKSLPLAGAVVLAQSTGGEDIWCTVGSLFGNETNVLHLNPPTESDQKQLRHLLAANRLSLIEDNPTPEAESPLEEKEPPLVITVLSCAPLVENSPLKADLSLKPKDSPKHKLALGKGKSPLSSDQKGSLIDKNIVFHEQIKSSGYTAAPRQGMFQPKTNKSHKTAGKSKMPNSALRPKEYPMESNVPTQVKVKLDVADRPTAINLVRFSEDGQHLGCALANTSAQVFKMPLTGKGLAFAGHSGSVTSLGWSYDNKWVITSSDDKTANVWSLNVPDPLLTISFSNNNFGTDKEGGLKPTKENPLLSKAVKFAQFYYMDKFILLTSGNTFYLYKYHLDTSKSDIKRYLSNNRYKIVKSFQMEQTQNITSFSAVNGFYSYIVLCAGSNKTLEVFDLNTGQSLRTIVDVHTKPAHTIQQNKGSPYVSHPPSAYDLFVTAAASDCIKLWDLRTDRCVRRYEGHQNRIHPCGVAISPCSKFIATGSEDRSAYVFDIRAGSYLHKFTGHTDTVGDVVYHPLYPQLVTASVDGKLRLFKEN